MPSAPQPSIVVALEYSIFAFGGTEVLVGELLRRLSGEYAFTLVSADASIAGTWAEPHVQRHIAWQPDADNPHPLLQSIAATKPAIVHFHLGGNYCWQIRRPARSGVTQSRRIGLRSITTNHGFFSPFEGYCAHYRPFAMKLALWPAAWLAKLRQLAAVRTEVAVSLHDYRRLCRWYWPMRRRFRQIYHSKLPATLPSPSDTREKLIVCLGTIGPRKGQTLLVQAFAKIADKFPEWRLQLIGRATDAAMVQSIEGIKQRHGLAHRVELIEGLSDSEVTQRLGSAEIFAMPSVYEGLGLALQEALYHGCACISTHSGGPEDLIEDGVNGLLVPREDPHAMALGLDRLISDPALRETFRRRGPASIRAKRMSAEEMAGAYRELYSSLL